jgi:hypothetical protein
MMASPPEVGGAGTLDEVGDGASCRAVIMASASSVAIESYSSSMRRAMVRTWT